jgi:hypothetical protein
MPEELADPDGFVVPLPTLEIAKDDGRPSFLSGREAAAHFASK